MSVSAVVPSWNRRALLAGLLVNLRAQTRPPEEIVVVDNGSTDGSAETAARAGARVIRMGANAGFARAVNQGIRAARCPWLAVLNNDVEPAADWLEKLLAAAERPGTWFATGKILLADNRASIDGAWDLLTRGACAWRAGNGRADGPAFSQSRAIWSAPWTAALFRRELFDSVGLLEERFESYLEDVEFGLRCALAGRRGLYVPDAIALHHGSATLGRWHPETVRRMARNQLFIAAKHYPARLLWRYAWAMGVAQLLWGVIAARHGCGMAFLRGKLEGLRRFSSMRPAAFAEGLAARLTTVLSENEQELRSLQKASGYDSYWRLYLAATFGGEI